MCVFVTFIHVRPRSRSKHVRVMINCVRNEILTLGTFVGFIV